MKTGIHHLCIPGPTNVPEAVRRAMSVPAQDHRAPDFPELTLGLFADLKRVFGMDSGEVMLFPGSGTAAWEAAITNTLSPGDRVVMARHGHFSALWARMAERLGLVVDLIDAPWGAPCPVHEIARRLGADRKGEIKAVFVTHNETATGVTSDIRAVRQAMDACFHDALLFVDAVSSLGSLPFQMQDWGIDLAVAGSQKGLMCPAGLGILGVSPKALMAAKATRAHRAYFAFDDMLAMNRDGYFPYTPPVPLLHGLRAALDRLFDEGLETVHARHHRLAEGIRRAVAAWGQQIVADHRGCQSDTVTAIRVHPDVDARQIIRIAHDRYNTAFGAGLGPLAGRAFRIGHIGDLNEGMCLTALGIAELAMAEAGVRVAFGSGVAAAQTYFARQRPAARPVERPAVSRPAITIAAE